MLEQTKKSHTRSVRIANDPAQFKEGSSQIQVQRINTT